MQRPESRYQQIMHPTRPLLLAALALAVPACCFPGGKKEQRETQPITATPEKTLGDTPKPLPKTAAPLPGQIPDIPPGRSAPPTLAEWSAAPSVNTQGAGSWPDNCFQKVVREWLKMHCEGKILRVEEKEGLGTQNVDHFESVVPGKYADYIVRMRPGVVIRAKIYRTEGNAAFFVNWPAGAPKPVHIAMGVGS